MDAIVGFEGGGTKTECAVIDRAGNLLGLGYGGPTNLNFVSPEQLKQSLSDALNEALKETGQKLVVRAAAVASPGRYVELDQAMQSLFEGSPCYNYQEHQAGLASAGVYDRRGVALIAGTGSSVRAYNGDAEVLFGGWGSVLGDEGGAYWIAIHGIKQAILEYEGRVDGTRLRDTVYNFFEVTEMRDLVPIIYRGGLQRHEIARFAEGVSLLAQEGYEPAYSICAAAATNLAQLAAEAATRFFATDDDFPIVLVGSVFYARPVTKNVIYMMQRLYPNAKVMMPIQQPALGVAILALKEFNDHQARMG